MDDCKCIVPSRHGGTINRCLAASPLVRLRKREERWKAPNYRQDVLPQNRSGTEQNGPPFQAITACVRFGIDITRFFIVSGEIWAQAWSSSEFPCWLLLVAELFYQLPPRGIRWD
ncbi:hypothetical protein TNCV_3378541 [Trichonephila clavipes]|nr:hypothetical protein TNCV_3378541 [Trichonephila clavipes]